LYRTLESRGNPILEIQTFSAIEDSGTALGQDILQAQSLIKSRELCILEDQVHALWYLIDCSADQPVQQSDRDILSGKLLRIGEIPVFIIFTKYDLLVANIRKKVKPGATIEQVEKQAEKYFRTEIEAEVKKSIIDNSRFSFCRVGLLENDEEYTPALHAKDSRSVSSS
jgi:hypothetical protein